MRVANCTTAAQFFHLLRRQASLLTVDPLPLIVLTPKSLLRHPLVASAPRELTEGRFRMVLQDTEAAARAAGHPPRSRLHRQGLYGSRRRRTAGGAADVAICRIEQLYPVPMRDLRAMIETYPNADEVVWVQEEPENMGAWEFIRPHLTEVSGSRAVRRVARPRSASPAEGSAARHALNQQALVNQASGPRLAGEVRVTQKGRRDAQLTSSKG